MKLSVAEFLWLQAKVSVKQLLVYRLAAVMTVVFGVLLLFAEYLVIDVYYSFDKTLSGFSRDAFLILFGAFNCMVVLYQFFFEIGHDQLTIKVKYGELDYDILRPYDTMFLTSFSQFEYANLFNLILPVYFIAIGIQGSETDITPTSRFIFLLGIPLGTYVIYLINQILVSLSFWFGNFSNFFFLTEAIVELGSKPLRVYPWILQVTFGFLIPVILATNFPVEILMGEATWSQFFTLAATTAFLTLLTRRIWSAGLKRYASASS